MSSARAGGLKRTPSPSRILAPENDEQIRTQERRDEKRRKSAEKEASRRQRLENEQLGELQDLDEIEASGWKALIDPEPTFWGDRSDATLWPLPHRNLYSASDFLRLILGSWLDEQLRPYIDADLEKCHKNAKRENTKHYRQLHIGELLNYVLCRCIEALQSHRVHQLDESKLTSALGKLMNRHRRNALSARFAVKPGELTAILASWTTHVCKFVKIGSVSAADEAIFPHLGKSANDARHLQHIPGKPHDFGMIAYVLAQRLQFTNAPIALALSINHIQRSLTPTECAIELHNTLTEATRNEIAVPFLVADSASCAAATLKRFALHGIKYCVSLKRDSKIVPTSLFEVSSSDLPLRMSRTYTDGTRRLEVVNGGTHKVHLLTDMTVVHGEEEPSQATKGQYKTAVHLFDKEGSQALVDIFQLDQNWALEAKEVIIHHHLGWDVLRPQDQQGSSAPLTFKAVKDMKVSQLRRIRELKLPKERHSAISKDKMLADLFPKELRQADAERVQAQERGRKQRARERLRELDLVRERVRGQHSDATPIRDFFDTYYNAIDRLNEDYSLHFFLRHWPASTQWGLHSAMFYFLNTVHALWEEHRYAHTLVVEGQAAANALLAKRLSIPKFVLNCAEALAPEERA